MSFTRRTFLQQLGWSAAALGIGGTTLGGWAECYQTALAQPSRRRLALLIGINHYSEQLVGTATGQNASLSGALTDVELQRQLLVQRFGFKAADVLALTDADATGQGILEAVRSHLVEQAQPEDLAVLHFSGYGGRIEAAQSGGRGFNAWLSTDGGLLERDLITLLQRLSTQRLTTVIDAGMAGGEQRGWGTLRSRSWSAVPTDDFALDTALLPRSSLVWPGVVLRGAVEGKPALERDWPGFSAGLLTYALTQVLWQTTPPLTTRALVQQATPQLQSWPGSGQQPTATARDARSLNRAPAYFITDAGRGAAGGLTALDLKESTVTLWLGGVSSLVLGQLQPGSLFRPLPGAATVGIESDDMPLLQLSQRQGLLATAKGTSLTDGAWSVGQLVQEAARVLAVDLSLVVALDARLGRVERVDATSALAAIPFVTSVTTGDELADCSFGRLPQVLEPTLTATGLGERSTLGRAETGAGGGGQGYGLFAPNRALLLGSVRAKDEAVKTAVGRMVPYLASLLALKLMRLTENRAASQVGVGAELRLSQPEPKVLTTQQTQPWSGSASLEMPPDPSMEAGHEGQEALRLTADSRVSYRVVNQSSQDLYINLLRFDSLGNCWALVPATAPAGNGASGEGDPPMPHVLAPGAIALLPLTAADWGLPRSAKWVETHIVASTQPLAQTLQLLRQQGIDSPRQAGLEPVAEPLTLARALLGDLTAAAAVAMPDLKANSQYGLHHSTWASLQFRYAIA